ncbi:MAG: hypothetical protein IBJ12_09195 [Sphingomonadaceae bacterium]|nr:hypothetical protein [Sphingomonadaceae bacterium]
MSKVAAIAFHASPPPGEWYNDPNALLFDGTGFHIFAQHRADAPAFERNGWARISSPDLLHWSDHRGVIPPDKNDAWSGSIVADGPGLEVWHTRHCERMQDQVMRRSHDTGQSWTQALASLGPARTDWRDPFVFRWCREWRMLLAVPCPWSADGTSTRSCIEIYRADASRVDWEKIGQIGPWNDMGVLWEVPLLLPDPMGDNFWSLIISRVDRRHESAWCDVQRWRGHFDGTQFARLKGDDDEGESVDCGPDYYAAMANVEEHWPFAERALVGWASNWQTARRMPWPGFHGGPIALPRQLTAVGTAPIPSIIDAFSQSAAAVPKAGLGQARNLVGPLALRIEGKSDRLLVGVALDGTLSVERDGAEWLQWRREFPATMRAQRTLSLFLDGPLIELHIGPDDRWITCALPQQDLPFMVSLRDNGAAVPFDWHSLA